MKDTTPCVSTYLRRPVLLLAVVIAIAASAMRLTAQTLENSAGRHYVIAFADTTSNTFDPRYPNRLEDAFFIYLYSAVDTRVTIDGVGYDRTIDLIGGQFTTINLNDPDDPAPLVVVTVSGHVSSATFTLDSDDPIVVYCYMVTKSGAEAWTPLAVEFWGTDYYAAALKGAIVKNEEPAGENNYHARNKPAPAQILIVSAFDGTDVTITPTGQLAGSAPTTVRLDAGQAYQIQSYVDTSAAVDSTVQADIGGTRIQASRPIGVISGNTRTGVIDTLSAITGNSSKNALVEALAPVDQHGKEFVYLPTWDARRITGAAGERIWEKRPAEIVRVYGTSENGAQGSYTVDSSGGTASFSVKAGKLQHFQLGGVAYARHFMTDNPAQVFMTSSAICKFLGTVGLGSYIGGKYDAWGASMVEVVPHEQWVSSAPFVVPSHPVDMEHFINVVTDAASKQNIMLKIADAAPAPVTFSRTVPGTDLVWGTVSLPSGSTCILSATDSTSRFNAVAYGLKKGHEEWRPGAAKKKDDDNDVSIASGGGVDQVLHPSEYEEYIALSYSYPVAPSRRVLADPDDYIIDSQMEGSVLTVDLRAVGDKSAGIRRIDFVEGNITYRVPDDNASGAPAPPAVNARFELIDPITELELIGRHEIQFRVSAIDPTQPATATVIITDRTGAHHEIPFVYTPGSNSIEAGATVGNLLEQNDPNPFSDVTTIRFSLAYAGHATVEVYNTLGEKIATLVDGVMAAGQHRVQWDRSNLPVGMYYYRLTAGEWSETRGMIVR